MPSGGAGAVQAAEQQLPRREPSDVRGYPFALRSHAVTRKGSTGRGKGGASEGCVCRVLSVCERRLSSVYLRGDISTAVSSQPMTVMCLTSSFFGSPSTVVENFQHSGRCSSPPSHEGPAGWPLVRFIG